MELFDYIAFYSTHYTHLDYSFVINVNLLTVAVENLEYLIDTHMLYLCYAIHFPYIYADGKYVIYVHIHVPSAYIIYYFHQKEKILNSV